jgi:SnoaL-like domain
MSVEASEAEAIEETREAHVAALNSGDVDAWAAAFADDGVQMPPNAPANVGRDSIRAWSGAFLGAFRAEFSLAPEEVQVAGPSGRLNAAPSRSPSLRRAGASPFGTPVSTSPSTNGSRALAGRWPGTSGTATTRYPACPNRAHRRVRATLFRRNPEPGLVLTSRGGDRTRRGRQRALSPSRDERASPPPPPGARSGRSAGARAVRDCTPACISNAIVDAARGARSPLARSGHVA